MKNLPIIVLLLVLSAGSATYVVGQVADFELLETLKGPENASNVEVVFKNSYISGKDISQTTRLKLKQKEFGQFIRESTDAIEPNSRGGEDYAFIAITNPHYSSGLTNAGSGKYGIVNIGQESRASSIHYNNPLAMLYFPLERAYPYCELAKTDSVSLGEISNSNGLADLSFTSIDSEGMTVEHSARFDLSRGVCVQSSVLVDQKKTTAFAEFSDDKSDIPSLVRVEIRYASVPDYKVDIEYQILSHASSKVSNEETYMTYYGLPEPDFYEQDSWWTWFLGASALAAFVLLAVWYTKKKAV
ncbi:hypothetical protein N9B31_06630 [Mariniblastus sp.]|nr:hypothetical protein [Mariniblastus sp.]MDB4481132.1 hypothetical protein [bacterium]